MSNTKEGTSLLQRYRGLNNEDKQFVNKVTCCCGSVTVVLILIFTLPFVIVVMPDTERGVAYSNLFARFNDEILESGGVHSKPYAGTVYKWPRVEETVEFLNNDDDEEHNNIVCNSNDGLLIDMHVSFQFFPDQDELLTLTKEYRTYGNWRRLMVRQAESSIRNVCGDFVADDFQTNRGAVALRMEQEVRDQSLDRFHVVVTKLQLRDVERPVEYEQAVKDKENARSEIRLAQNEEEQAVIQAETKIDVANEERIRLLDSANTTAEIKLAQAENTANGVRDRFQQLASVYSAVMTRNRLSIPGILTYISNEIFHQDITIAVDTPAKVTFRDEL